MGHLLPGAFSIMLDYKDKGENTRQLHLIRILLFSVYVSKGVQTMGVRRVYDGLGLWPPAAAGPWHCVHVLR